MIFAEINNLFPAFAKITNNTSGSLFLSDYMRSIARIIYVDAECRFNKGFRGPNFDKKLKRIQKHIQMKKLFILFCSVLILNNSHAQDTILKNNGDTILAQITEIASGQIKYKRANFPDGPNYLELKSEIAMIKYASGLKESFAQESQKPQEEYYKALPAGNNKIELRGHGYMESGISCPESYIYDKMLQTKNPTILKHVADSKKFKGLQYIGFLAIPFGIAGLATVTRGGSEYYYLAGALCIGASITCPILAGVFKQKRHNNLNQAVKIYNQTY
jgi:hypothetical protein